MKKETKKRKVVKKVKAVKAEPCICEEVRVEDGFNYFRCNVHGDNANCCKK